MSFINEKCHGQFNTIILFSKPIFIPTRIFKFFWHLKNEGLRKAFSTVTLRTRRFLVSKGSLKKYSGKNKYTYEDTLNLQAGEWVRVKSEEDILASLDKCCNNKGLAWMPIMNNYCGKKLKVYKRVNKIVLESTGEIRILKNTVLLEGAICNGIYGCDRSCFHFWREAWLERIDQNN